MRLINKVFAVLACLIFAFPFTFISASAEEDFKMKSFDKGYVTFIFDDGRMPFTEEVANLFIEYGIPMSCAVSAKNVTKGNELYNILVKVQQNGGEILSHGYNHRSITSQELSAKNNAIYQLSDIEYELGNSWKRLTNLGFNINGYIETGCGGDEKTADYALVETVARKYYKYSNAAGLSEQYTKSRTFMNWKTMSGLRDMITKAAQTHEWIILSAHSFKEISSDAPSEDTAALREILDFIKSKNGEIEVVTWNYIYTNFGEYSGSAVPSAESLSFLNKRDGDDAESLNKSAVTESPVSSKTSSIESSASSVTTETKTESEDVSSQEAVSKETETESKETPTEVEAEIVEKKSIGKIIAVSIAITLAVASIIAAIIVAIKFR